MLNGRSRRTVIGPDDQGRRMTLERFDRATGREGYVYELNKGVSEVTDVPHPRHFALLQEVRDQLISYRLAHPEEVHSVMGSNESKILLAADQSERHPDISVYLSAPPDVEDVWSLWVPAIVVEIVSKSSTRRDYQEKPGEYLSFGIDEYWIVDGVKNQMTVLARWRGQWQEKILKPTQKHTTRHLPGFSLDLKRVFVDHGRK